MTKFIRRPSHPYTIITPETPLEELEQFLSAGTSENGADQKEETAPTFALGESHIMLKEGGTSATHQHAVTDPNRKFVLAVATPQDLEVLNSMSIPQCL